MSKTFHFIAGMPRAGSTLLANLLNQNPRFDATASSAILAVIIQIKEQWETLFAHAPNEQAKIDVMRGVLHSFYQRSGRAVVFDKCRGWLAQLEMLELLLERPVKVLVPVRDIRAILASFEKLWRKNLPTTTIPQEKQFLVDFQSIEGRCEVWLRKDQPVGLAYTRIEDAILRGLRDRLYFVHFNRLTAQPRQALQSIYRFLGEEWYEHNFNHVEQVTWEDDLVHGMKGLHDIRSKIEPVADDYAKVLGPIAEKYKGVYVWDQPQNQNPF